MGGGGRRGELTGGCEESHEVWFVWNVPLERAYGRCTRSSLMAVPGGAAVGG